MLKKIFHTTSLKANIIANFAGNGWSALISIIFVPIYLRYVGAEGYGLLGIFTSLQTALYLLDSGLSATLNKELARLNALENSQSQMRNLVKTLGNIYWIIALVAGTIALFLSPVIAHHWVKPKELSVQTITYAFFLLSITFVFQFPCDFYSGGIVGLQRQVGLNMIKICFAIFRSILTVIVLMFYSSSVLAFFSCALFVSILQAIVFRYLLWHYLPKANTKAIFDKAQLKTIRNFATGITLTSITAILLTQIDKIVLSKMLSLEQFGYYTISCTLGLMIYQIVGPLSQSYFPKFAAFAGLNDTISLKKFYHESCQLISTLVLPATFILVFFSKELIFIWTRNEVIAENTFLITSIYAFGTALNGLLTIPYLLTLSYGWTKLGIYQNAFFLIITVPLIIFLASHYGAVGGAASWAIINLFYFFITPHLIHNKLLKGEVAHWYWYDTLKPLLPCLAVIAFSKYLFIQMGGIALGRFTQLTTIIIIGMLAVMCSILFSDSLRNGIFTFYKNKNND